MSSAPSVANDVLRTLHRIHRQLTDLRERSERGPRQIRAGEANIQQRQTQLAALQTQLKTMKVAADQKQLQLKGAEDKVKDLKRKLNSAESNREYQLLKDHIAADEMATSVLADEILEALDEIDQFQPKITEGQQTLKQAQQRVETLHKEVAEQEPLIRGDIQRLEAELKEQEAALPPLILDVYQRMVRGRGEDALAVIEKSGDEPFCGGCNQQVPLNTYAEVRMSHPMFCKSCGRLLYLGEGDGK